MSLSYGIARKGCHLQGEGECEKVREELKKSDMRKGESKKRDNRAVPFPNVSYSLNMHSSFILEPTIIGNDVIKAPERLQRSFKRLNWKNLSSIIGAHTIGE